MGAESVLIEHNGQAWDHVPAQIIGKNRNHYFIQTEDGDVVKAPIFGHSLLPGQDHPRCCGGLHGAYRGEKVDVYLRLEKEIGWVLRSDYHRISRDMDRSQDD